MDRNEQQLLADILEELQRQNVSKKDGWDRFGVICTFLSTVVLAGLGLYLSHQFNEAQGERELLAQRQQTLAQEQQTRVLEMQTVEKFIPHLTADEDTKRIALLAISSLGSPEFATKFAQLSPSEGTAAAADQIMRGVTAAPSTPATRPPTATPDKGSHGWAYLGHYREGFGTWKTRYLDFPVDQPPAELVGQTLSVPAITGALNVREGMPSSFGSFGSVIGTLNVGDEAEILEVEEWLSSGYMWARIVYHN